MKKSILLIIPVLLLLTLILSSTKPSYSLNNTSVSIKELSRNKAIIDSFPKEYNITYKIDNSTQKDELVELTKKATYLLIGPANNINEKYENYYKRKRALYSMTYQLDIPRDPNDPTQPDTNSDEYYTNLAISLIVGKTFQLFEDARILYNDFGEVTINSYNDIVAATIKLNNAKIRTANPDNPMEFIYQKQNYMIHYFFKEYKGEYKIQYLYGESEDEYNEYYNVIDSLDTTNSMAIAPVNNDNLRSVYDFSKLDNFDDNILNTIFEKNKENIFFLNSYYENTIVSSSTGFLINDGILLTTWDFLEKALVNGQFIAIQDSFGKDYEAEGIITANPNNNLVLIKLKDKIVSNITIGNTDELKQTDVVSTISNPTGTGAIAQKGIITNIGNYIATTIPISYSDTGAPLFDTNGNIVGIATSKTVNSSISYFIPSAALVEVKEKFNNIDYDSIKTIKFEEIKEKFYYIKQSEEKALNNIPNNVWNEFSKIGNLKEKIKHSIVKASYQNNVLSIRYKNNLSEFISNMTIAIPFKDELLKTGYKEVLNSSKKCIYENDKYRILILDELDYLIIVMVKL